MPDVAGFAAGGLEEKRESCTNGIHGINLTKINDIQLAFTNSHMRMTDMRITAGQHQHAFPD
jgi:hypothetical protein